MKRLRNDGPVGTREQLKAYDPESYALVRDTFKLSPEQVTKLSTILDASRALFKEVADKHKPEFDAIQQHQTAQVNGILDDTQRAEYKKIQEEREERRKNHSRGR